MNDRRKLGTQESARKTPNSGAKASPHPAYRHAGIYGTRVESHVTVMSPRTPGKATLKTNVKDIPTTARYTGKKEDCPAPPKKDTAEKPFEGLDNKRKEDIENVSPSSSRRLSKYEEELTLLRNQNDELVLKQTEMEDEMVDVLQMIEDKEIEVNHVRQQLDDSQLKRQLLLEELGASRTKYREWIEDLKGHLEEMRLKNKELEDKENEGLSLSCEKLKKQLNDIQKEKVEIQSQLDVLQLESEKKEVKISELDKVVHLLEGSLKAMEEQRKEMAEAYSALSSRNDTQECPSQNPGVSDSSGGPSEVQKVLQEQLDRMQTSWDTTKEQLILEKTNRRELEKQLQGIEKEYNLAKTEVRYLTREHKKVEENLARRNQVVKEIREQMASHEETKNKLESRVTDLEGEIDLLKKKEKQAEETITELRNTFEALTDENKTLAKDLKRAKTELRKTSTDTVQLQNLRSRMKDMESDLQKQKGIIQEKDDGIQNKEKVVGMLKEACTVLEDQVRDFETALKKKTVQEEESIKMKSDLEEKLRQSRIDLNELKSMKIFHEKKISDLQVQVQTQESSKSAEATVLRDRLDQQRSKNDELLLQMSKLEQKLEDLQAHKDESSKITEKLKIENVSHKDEVSRTINLMVGLQNKNDRLQNGLREAIVKAENLKKTLTEVREEKEIFENETHTRETQFQMTIAQQMRLIEYLQSINDKLLAKKKFRLFGKNKENVDVPTTPCKTSYNPNVLATPKTPKIVHATQATLPRRVVEPEQDSKAISRNPKEIMTSKQLEEEVLAMKQLEEEVQDLKNRKNQLMALRSSKEKLQDIQIHKVVVLRDEGKDRLAVNCVQYMHNELYLLGCDDGLYSRRLEEDMLDFKVRIDGVGQVHQIGLISHVNIAIMIEGEERRLTQVQLSLLRACVEAAECSNPKIEPRDVADLKDCSLFEVLDCESPRIVVSTPKCLCILQWDGLAFSIVKQIITRETATCIINTPNSVIYGCGKFLEVDILNFHLDEFIDESDQSYFMLMNSRQFSTFPIAVVDVGLCNYSEGDSSYNPEYFVCYPEMGFFVDSFGRRTRPEDINWESVAFAAVYCHPNLFIVHASSVEIIHLRPNSYTKGPMSVDGQEQMTIIPESRFISLTNARLLGKGMKSNALIVGSMMDKKTEILEISYAREPEHREVFC